MMTFVIFYKFNSLETRSKAAKFICDLCKNNPNI